MKKIFLTILILILMNSIFAANLGISPSMMEFNQSANERICKKAIIFTDSNETIIGKSIWSKDSRKIPEKDIKNYKTEPESQGLIFEYTQEIQVYNKKEIDVCLTARTAGNYSGALLYQTKDKPAGVGVWIYASITGQKKGSLAKITGGFLDSAHNPDTKKIKMRLSITASVLLFILIILLIIQNKKHLFNHQNP
jgi:hypothetical protein